MLKQVLSCSAVFALLLAGSLSASAQTQPQKPQPQAQPSVAPQTNPQPSVAPRTNPQPSAPRTNPQPSTPQVKIETEELQKFSNAIKQMAMIEQDLLTRMKQEVKKQGLSEERFIQIHQATQQAQTNPNARSEAKITPQEQKKYDQAHRTLGKMQEESQEKMLQAVEKEGLNAQRFNQILAAVRDNPQLQETVQRMIKG